MLEQLNLQNPACGTNEEFMRCVYYTVYISTIIRL